MRPILYRIGWLLTGLSIGHLVYATCPECTYTENGLAAITQEWDRDTVTEPQTVRFSRNADGQCTAIVRAPGTPFERTTHFLYSDDGQLLEKTIPDGTTLYYMYDADGSFAGLRSSDGTVDYTISYERVAHFAQIDDRINSLTFTREFDDNRNIVKETFPGGFTIAAVYDDQGQRVTLQLPEGHGSVVYTYEGKHLSRVMRLSSSGEVCYIHHYQYDAEGSLSKEVLIGDMGILKYTRDDHAIIVESPCGIETSCFDLSGNLTLQQSGAYLSQYAYDDAAHLLLHGGYDSLHNSLDAEVNELNELLVSGDISCDYDLNGNVVAKHSTTGSVHFAYDALGRLTKAFNGAVAVYCTYDFFGRRWSKSVEHNGLQHTEYYLYHDNNELIALNSDGSLRELRIPGASFHKDIVKAVAIETSKITWAPIYNVQGSITTLIDLATKTVVDFSALDPFGTNLQEIDAQCPWIFASKRFDPELNLVYFGQRYYDPELRRWMTPDPIGFVDGLNPYTYVFNNPLRYTDPDGLFAIAIPILVWGVPFFKVLCDSLVIGVASWGAYTVSKEVNAHLDRQEKRKQWEEGKVPPYKGSELGWDPSKCPGKGFEWRGSGSPRDGKGNWFDKEKKHSLRPDLNHPEGIKPHWDYKGPEGEARLFQDGTWEPKK